MVDSGFIGELFSRRLLKRIADECEKQGHCLVVPEVAVWEWAEHAQRTQSTLQTGLSTDGSVTMQACLGDVEAQVSELGANIFGSNNADPSSAIFQQVTVTGTGEWNGKVKTGAADALVINTARALSDSFDLVILGAADGNLSAQASKLENVEVRNSIDKLVRRATIVPCLSQLVVKRAEDYVITWADVLTDLSAADCSVRIHDYSKLITDSLKLEPCHIAPDLVHLASRSHESMLLWGSLRAQFLAGVTFDYFTNDGECHHFAYQELRFTLGAEIIVQLDEDRLPVGVERTGSVSLRL